MGKPPKKKKAKKKKKVDRRAIGKASKEKGAVGERTVAKKLLPVFPEARRRCTGEETQDEIRGRDLDNTPGYCVQVHNGKTNQILKKIEEARAAAVQGEIPIAITRRVGGSFRGTPWLLTMYLDDFVELNKKEVDLWA